MSINNEVGLVSFWGGGLIQKSCFIMKTTKRGEIDRQCKHLNKTN